MLILSTLLYLALSLLVSLRVYKHVSFSNSVIIFFLVTITINTLVFQILSLFHVLNQPWLFLTVQLFFCLVFGFILFDPLARIFKEKIPSLKFGFSQPRGWDWFLIALISGIFLLAFYIGSLVPINNSDSLHTHLPRIYYWIQHGSMAYWDATTVTQLNYPVILSLQGAWLFLLGGSEALFYLAPWFALITTVVLIYELAVLLGSSRRSALLAALISLSFPVSLLQTFSYQADVFVSSLGLASLFFLMTFINKKQNLFLHVSFLPLVLALGSKQTAFIFLPFFLLAVLKLYRNKYLTVKDLVRSGVVLILLFAALSSYKFIQNTLDREKMSSSMFATYRYAIPFAKEGDGQHYATNALRYFYNGTSVDGLTGRAKLAAINGREKLFRGAGGWLKIDLEVKDYVAEGDKEYFEYSVLPPLNEDAAWFGPLSLILFPLTAFVVLIGKNKLNKHYLWFSVAYILTTFLLISILLTSWNPAHGRYLVLPLLVMTPLLSVLLPVPRVRAAIITVLFSIAAVYLSVSALLINDSNPLITRYSLYSYQENRVDHSKEAGFFTRAYAYISDRVIEDLALTSPDRKDILHQSYYENLFHQSATDIPDIEFVNANVGPTETLYLYINKNIIEYALFGVNKTRDLVPVTSLQQVPSGALVLVDKGRTTASTTGMNLLAENENFSIYLNP